MTTLPLRKSIGRSPLRLAFLLIPLALTCFAVSPAARAVLPAPDGGYPNENTAEGEDALFSLTTGADNAAIGFDALYSNTTGSDNTATGPQALHSNTTGNDNTANGDSALYSNTTGDHNTAIGWGTLQNNTTGNENTANGHSALNRNTTGNSNIALGFNAGVNLTTGNNNIDIGNDGVAAEANTVRIGRQGTQTRTFIAGISGTGVMGSPVKINGSGQLGVAPSSARFKQEIQSMDKTSDVLLALRPVTFRYKPEIDPQGVPQFGLVAEEVEKVSRDLVARDTEGKVYTVRYEAVNAMLLNEFLKAHRKIEDQQATIIELKSTVAQQQKGLQTVTARLEQQAAQIQKVSAQLDASKPATQVVKNP